MRRDYPKLDILTFGRHLLDSGDLDPMYIALTKAADGDEDLIKRWLVAYWSLYHCGAASWLAERKGAEFWGHLMDAAENVTPAPPGGRWPRGHERRHWRAQNATTACAYMSDRWATPEDMVDYLAGTGGPFSAISARAREIPGNGPWIAFKIGDTLERCLGVPVDFTEAEVFLFDTPKEAALMLWRKKMGLPDSAQPKDLGAVIGGVCGYLGKWFADHQAPPSYDRALGLQELETILCKWKSHMGGHYPLNNDIIDIRAGLAPWVPLSNVASAFLHYMPKE